MPQNPIAGKVVGGSQMTGVGGSSKLNLTAAAALKTGPGRVGRVFINVAGTGGTLTINDCATTGAATTANTIFTISGTITLGTIITLDFPFTTGLVVSAVPTGATLAVSYT